MSGELFIVLGVLALLCVPVAVALLVVLRRDAKQAAAVDRDGAGAAGRDPLA